MIAWIKATGTPPWLTWSIIAILGILGGAIAYRALFADRSRGRRRCKKCWYDMSGVAGSLRCPECGRQFKCESDLHRTRRRKIPAIVGLIIALALPTFMLYKHAAQAGWVYLILPKWKVIDNVSVQGFEVQTLEIRNPSAKDWSRKLRIQRDGETLFQIPGFYFTVGAPVTSNGAKKTVGLGDDITGDGKADLVIIEDSGGSGCMMKAYVFGLELERGFVLQPIAVLNFCGRFEDVNGDGQYEFIAGDRTFAYRWTSGADSPHPEVIMQFKSNGYFVAPELMRKPPPSRDDLLNRIQSFRNAPPSGQQWDWNTRFAALLSVVLDLIYSGNETLAWEFFDQHWPEGDSRYEKEKFKEELQSALKESPFAAEIRALNANTSD